MHMPFSSLVPKMPRLRIHGSAFKLTVLVRMVAVIAGIAVVTPQQQLQAQIPVTDVAGDASLVSILVETGLIESSAATTASATQSMNTIRTARQLIAYALTGIQVLDDFGKLIDGSPNSEIKTAVDAFLQNRSASALPMDYINRIPPFTSITYNGSSIQGHNGGDIESLVGLTGALISADRVVPQAIMAVPQAANDALNGVYRTFQSGGIDRAGKTRGLASTRNARDLFGDGMDEG